MGSGKGKARRVRTTQKVVALSALRHANMVLRRGEHEHRRLRNGLARAQSASSGSHGRVVASGELTFGEGNEAILIGGRESTLSYALLNSHSLIGEDVDFLVQPASEIGESLEGALRRTRGAWQVQLQGRLELEESGCLRVDGEDVRKYLGSLLGRKVDVIVFPRNKLFLEESRVDVEKLTF